MAALIHFRRERERERERQTQPLKTRFSIKSRPFYFHINSTVIRPVKLDKLIFSSIEITKPLTDGRCQTLSKALNISSDIASLAPHLLKALSNSIRYNCLNICSRTEIAEARLKIRNKATFPELINKP